MKRKEQRNLVFDTSALLRLANSEKGGDKVEDFLNKSRAGNYSAIISTLTVYEIVSKIGEINYRKAIEFVVFLDQFCFFVAPDLEVVKYAGLLKLKHKMLNLSAVDSIIIQTGIQNNAEIITGDREWLKVSNARVSIV